MATQMKVECKCGREVAVTRTSGLCDDGQYHEMVVTRRHSNCNGTVISIVLKAN
jgi:hypothetical protein